MSNPVINRLGVNQFWYRYWYSDRMYSLNLQQDKISTDLVKFAINAGSTFNSNPFVHEYWYKPAFKKSRILGKVNRVKFFRRYFYSHSMLSIEHSYLIRNLNVETFPMRMWVFRFNNWFIISAQTFKPLKGRNVSLKDHSLNPSYASSFSTINKRAHRSTRVKFLLSLLKLQQANLIKNSYLF